MSKDTVISHGKDIVYVVPHFNSLSLGMVRSQFGAFWRGLTAMDVRIFTRNEIRVDFPRTHWVGKSICKIHRSSISLLTCRSVNDISPFIVPQCHASRLSPTSKSL